MRKDENMPKKMIRPVIDVECHYEGDTTIYEAFGKVYAQIFREKLNENTIAPLIQYPIQDTVKSSQKEV